MCQPQLARRGSRTAARPTHLPANRDRSATTAACDPYTAAARQPRDSDAHDQPTTASLAFVLQGWNRSAHLKKVKLVWLRAQRRTAPILIHRVDSFQNEGFAC